MYVYAVISVVQNEATGAAPTGDHGFRGCDWSFKNGLVLLDWCIGGHYGCSLVLDYIDDLMHKERHIKRLPIIEREGTKTSFA